MAVHRGPLKVNRLLDCWECGFAHLWPLPEESTVAAYYEDDQFYATHSPPDWFEKEQREHKAGLWWPYYDYLAGLLDSGKPVIDWGCGSGWFIDRLIDKHWFAAVGVEPSAVARRWSPVKDFIVSDPHKLSGLKGNVSLILTLEHIHNPERWLRTTILPHLDGKLLIVVPNEFNPLQAQAKGDWFVSDPHLNYFTPYTLGQMMNRLGLSVTHVSATFPMELAIVLGYDYRGNDKRGRKWHNIRLGFEKKLGTRAFDIYGKLFNRWGWGREIIMVAE
jgi:hypothetical protein